MKKVLTIIALTVFTTGIAFAQTDSVPKGPWTFTGMAGLNLSQVALVNWSQGGENSQSVSAVTLLKLGYVKNKSAWDNSLSMGYGVQRKGNDPTTKMNDEIDFLSKYGYKTGGKWFVSGLFNFKTQFYKGYKGEGEDRILISDLMAPAYLSFNLGMEYKPNEHFYLLLSPIGIKTTIVTDEELSAQGGFGVEPGETFRAEMGAAARVGLNFEIMKNVTLNTSADLFSNLLNKPGNIDLNWKTLIDMKINEFLSANITMNLLYDDEIDYIDAEGLNQGPRVQFKEVLAVGIAVKF
jgi:hypothetical protein